MIKYCITKGKLRLVVSFFASVNVSWGRFISLKTQT